MPVKKSNNKVSLSSTESKLSKHDSDTESESDEDTKPVNKKIMSVKKVKHIEDDSEDDDEPKEKIISTKVQAKTEIIDDDSEEVDIESDSETESESDDNQDKKLKEKKSKETFEENIKKLDILQSNIKTINKEISEINKNLKMKEKILNDYERQRNSIIKILPKAHHDEVVKAQKKKTKRPGNAKGGFCSVQPVPDILIKFLDLKDDEKCLRRPSVTSKLSNKFSEMGLKKGQETTLNEKVVKDLELDKSYVGKVINFGEFQTFLKGFYSVKEEKNTVSVA